MKATRDEQKKKARELMETLRISWLLKVMGDVDWFSRFGNVEFFSAVYENPKIGEMITSLEKEHDILVYYVTHEKTTFGECYSFLYVSSYLEDFPHHDIRVGENGEMVALAWVWNVDMEHCSEFGSIVVKNEHGVLLRIG